MNGKIQITKTLFFNLEKINLVQPNVSLSFHLLICLQDERFFPFLQPKAPTRKLTSSESVCEDSKKIMNKVPKKKAPLIRLNSDPKILPSTEESRQLEIFQNGIMKENQTFRGGGTTIDRGSAAGGGILKSVHFKEPDSKAFLSSSGTRNQHGKMLVKQKSLGRTLSTSVLRIKKKRSFWSNEKFKQ